MTQFPEAFQDAINNLLPDNEVASFFNALKTEAPTSVRIHPTKGKQPEHSTPVPWCSNAFYLNERPQFTFDPLFHAGTYYVQEAGSMFIDHIIRSLQLNETPISALDLCAAPGGKTTLIQSALHQESSLVANEVIQSRNAILRENIAKWGADNVIMTQNDPKDFSKFPPLFDLMVIDAPCSGEGLFRKTPEAVNEWSEENVQLCCGRQQRIVEDAIPALKAGGYMIYSTCTYNTHENDNNFASFINDFDLEPVSIPYDENWGILKTDYGYQFMPHRTKSEGFYIAILKLKGEFEEANTKRNKKAKRAKKAKKTKKDKAKPLELPDFIKISEKQTLIPQEDKILVVSENAGSLLTEVKKHLYVKKAGVTAGEWLKNKFVPHHELALTENITLDLPTHELTKEEAITYLQKNDIGKMPFNGWGLVSYRGQNIGFIKGINNRSNNYYPKEWRIRKQS